MELLSLMALNLKTFLGGEGCGRTPSDSDERQPDRRHLASAARPGMLPPYLLYILEGGGDGVHI